MTKDISSLRKIDMSINECWRFMNSMRGQLILGQALTIAITELSKEENPQTSSISDMKFILMSNPTMAVLGKAITGIKEDLVYVDDSWDMLYQVHSNRPEWIKAAEDFARGIKDE